MSALLVILVASATAFVIGTLVVRLLRVGQSPDPIANAGVAMATGISVVALLYEIPLIHWTPLLLRVAVTLLFVVWAALVPWKRVRRSIQRWPLSQLIVMGALVGGIAALSFVQVSNAPVPAGVDSAHHIMLTRLIAANGRVVSSLEPFISGGRLAYHWGAHANAATIAMLLGRTEPFDVAAVLTAYAAFLRIACCLAIYAAARRLFADRYAALLAAAVAAGVSALPTELVTQGRFTQLAGVAVLPALLAIPARPGREWGRFALTAILLAGTFLLQARLVVFGVAWIVSESFFRQRRLRATLWHIAAPMALAGLLVLPWSIRLAADPLARSMLRGDAFAQSANRWTQRHVPEQMVWLTNNGILLSGATAGATGIAGLGVSPGGRAVSGIWFIVVAVAALKSRKKRLPWPAIALVAAWVLLSAAMLFVRPGAVDVTNVVPYAAGALTVFIPVILIAAAIAAAVFRILLPRRVALAAAAVALLCGVVGVLQAPRFAVPSVVPDADRRAFEWIRGHVAPDATFAVMAHPFNGIFVGQDAGYWVGVLTDRRSIPPPMIYGWVSPPANVERTNGLLRLWTTIAPESSVPQLMQAGLTHAYIGSASAPQTRAIMRQSPRFRIVYDRDDVLVAEMVK